MGKAICVPISDAEQRRIQISLARSGLPSWTAFDHLGYFEDILLGMPRSHESLSRRSLFGAGALAGYAIYYKQSYRNCCVLHQSPLCCTKSRRTISKDVVRMTHDSRFLSVWSHPKILIECFNWVFWKPFLLRRSMMFEDHWSSGLLHYSLRPNCEERELTLEVKAQGWWRSMRFKKALPLHLFHHFPFQWPL